MTVSELKLKIFRQVDALDKNQLEKLHDMLQAYEREHAHVHAQNDVDTEHWEALTDAQRKGILDAIAEIEAGAGIPGEKVMANIREKYLNV
ncbi:hypothetical protein CYPRO_1326 [Cyclonatronum proteinivorum]|uniref:Addiction module component n=2 Tax=Cyclonatronum proteinivorum TaxID=1457365 RepID=A0A345UJD1_9BACT|nr:hypothetical protein CYPRO_1326 [Cyclonatronum proteinivorum]